MAEYGQANAPPGSFSQVSAGGSHSCALDLDGEITYWGGNHFGQTLVPSGRFSQLGTGSIMSCALREDGDIACWRRWHDPRIDAESGRVSQFSAGAEYDRALREDDAVVRWGNDPYQRTPPPSGRFTQISSGDRDSCAVRDDGAMPCWCQTNVFLNVDIAEVPVADESTAAESISMPNTGSGGLANASGQSGSWRTYLFAILPALTVSVVIGLGVGRRVRSKCLSRT